MIPHFENVYSKRRNSSRKRTTFFNSYSDLCSLIISLGAVLLVVIFLGSFAYGLNSSVRLGMGNFTKSPLFHTLESNATSSNDDVDGSFVSPSNSSTLRAKPASFELFSPIWSAAVYSDHTVCSDIGRSILLRGGNAMDAAIAAFFCLSAALPHRGGLGSGLMSTQYFESKCTTLNARETCPIQGTEAYFSNRLDETVVVFPVFGPKAVGVPVFLNGLYRAFEKYSSKRLAWRQLVSPTVDLCIRGITVTNELSRSLEEVHSLIMNNSRMRSHFVNETTREVVAEGEKMYCPLLANFLREVLDSDDPVDFFYRGKGSIKLLKSVQGDGFINANDLEDCESEFQPSIQMFIGGHTICGPPPPSTYSVAQLAVVAMYEANSTSMNIPISLWNKSKLIGDPLFDEAVLNDALGLAGKDSVQDILRRFRNRSLPETKYEPEEEGSFSVLVVDEKGGAVSMTSSLGDKFGSREFTELGFFLNNAMGSFTFGAEARSVLSRNAPQPAKCPRTRMSPLIGTKTGEVSFLSGGTDYLGTCMSLLRALTQTKSMTDGGTPLLYRNKDGLHLLNKDESFLAGY